MATDKQRNVSIQERRAEAAFLFLQGVSQAEIGKRLGIAQQTVSDDIQAAIAEWKKQAVKDVDTAKAIELEKLAGIESAAWQGYEESRTQIDRRTGEPFIGDPNPTFLGIILATVTQRCKVLGVVVPGNKTSITQVNNYQAGHAMSREQMRDAVTKVLGEWKSKAVQAGTGLPAMTLDGITEREKES